MTEDQTLEQMGQIAIQEMAEDEKWRQGYREPVCINCGSEHVDIEHLCIECHVKLWDADFEVN